MELARLWAAGDIDTRQDDDQEEPELHQAAAVFGLVIQYEERAPEYVYLWPENVATWRVWMGLQTQWHAGFAGPTGLDYAELRRAVADACPRGARASAARRRADMTAALQAMERAVLTVWDSQKKKR